MQINKFTLYTLIILLMTACKEKSNSDTIRIVFLHHSTGQCIWDGGDRSTSLSRIANNFSTSVSILFLKPAFIPSFFKHYNKSNNTRYVIENKIFPKAEPYGWNNYPYDYYNIWVKHAGNEPYMEEPTLEILTKKYDIIIMKHCFPISRVSDDNGIGDINSDEKKIENYVLQYNALKRKMAEFPRTKFIIWTPAVCVQSQISKEQALKIQEFYNWLMNEWDVEGDNVFLWDFYKYETEGELFLLDKYAVGPNDSHPNPEFSINIAPLLCQYIIDVIEGKELSINKSKNY